MVGAHLALVRVMSSTALTLSVFLDKAVVADGVTAVLETRPAFSADCAVHLVHGADRARLEHPTRSAKCLISGALAAEPVFTVPTSVDRIASDRHRTRALVACRGAL